MAPRQYDTRDQATAAWLRRAKRSGGIVVLGGGWWQLLDGSTQRYSDGHVGAKRLQGLGALAEHLERRGQVVRVPAGDQASGIWAWQLAPQASSSARSGPAAHPFHQLAAVDQRQLPAGVPPGRHCAWCGKPGGGSHLVEDGARMRAWFLHGPCVGPFKRWRAERQAAPSSAPGEQ